MSELLSWIEARPGLIVTTVLISVVTFFGTLIIVPILLSKMRADYFVGERAPSGGFAELHPVLRLTALLLKNLLGAVLLIMGIAMLVLPGQGLLTIVIALALLDFPQRRAVLRRLVSYDRVRRAINWIRRRAEKPPIILDD